jgi:uncharacterized membrane protein
MIGEAISFFLFFTKQLSVQDSCVAILVFVFLEDFFTVFACLLCIWLITILCSRPFFAALSEIYSFVFSSFPHTAILVHASAANLGDSK